MPILGLLSTESFDADRYKNVRRQVFHNYPNGKAPLCGLLSLITEGAVNKVEDSDDPEFSWWEDRYQSYRTTTVSQGSSKGPFMRSDGSTDASDPVDDGSAGGWKAGTEYTIKVASTAFFRIGHILHARVKTNGGTLDFDLRAIVTAITSSTVVKVRALQTHASIDNGTTNENVGVVLRVVGHAAEQGDVIRGNAIHTIPVAFNNYCGIHRTHFDLTGTSIKTALKYDQSGPYRERAKKAALEHMIGIEMSLLFGVKSKYVGSSGRPTYTSSGVIEFLRAYEAADSTYRGGSGAPAITSDSDDDKRIINNTTGIINEKTWDRWMERAFRVTHNQVNEKLAFCGNEALLNLNQLFRSKGVLQHRQASNQTYGMDIVSHLTPFGTVHYKTHPLFNHDPVMRKWVLILDVANLTYRHIAGRDTILLPNRQANDEDVRRDEWLSECGIELRFPESHMLIQNVADFAP